MTNAMIITGPVVLVRLKLTTSWASPSQPNSPDDRTADQAIMDLWSSTQHQVDVQLRHEDAKAELTSICRTALRSADVQVTQLTLRPGSLEVLALLTTTAMVVNEFGAIMQGIREILRLIPEPVTRFVRDLAGRSLPPVEVTVTETPRAEMHSGMLSATPATAPPSHGTSRRRGRRRGSRPERPAVPPTAVATVSDAPVLSGPRLTTYLLASHAVLTLVLIASVVYLTLARS